MSQKIHIRPTGPLTKDKKRPPDECHEEAALFGRYASWLLTMGGALRGTPLVGEITLERSERLSLAKLDSIATEVKKKLREKTSKNPICLSGDELANISVTLWEALVDVEGEQRRRTEALATKIVNCVSRCLHDAASKYPGSTCSVNFTQAQRRVISEIAPQFVERLKTNERNPRTIRFALPELNEIYQAAKTDYPNDVGGMRRNTLRCIIPAVVKAIADHQGIGSIPVTERLHQFKITLNDHQPPIWRRIQIKDCTLDRLHDHIQLAMGWTNSHLYQFYIDNIAGAKRRGDYAGSQPVDGHDCRAGDGGSNVGSSQEDWWAG